MSADRSAIAPLVRRIGCLSGVRNHPLGFAAVLLGWQIVLLLALFYGLIELGLYAGIHFGGCFVLAAWLFQRSITAAVDGPESVALQIVAWSAFAGPFGAFVAMALLFQPVPTHSKIRSGNDAESLSISRDESKRVEHVHLALLNHRVRLGCAHQTRPLMDVIAEGSQWEKLEALGIVCRRYDADLGAVLKRALQDPDTSVRVLAATVAAKLHATFSRKIGDCETATDATTNLAQSWRNVADARLAYAESGLLDAPRARTEIEFAIGDLLRAAEIDPVDRDTGSSLDRARRLLATRRL
jgi:hypothetical protein